MIEDTVREFLSSKMTAPVWMEIPKNPPKKMIIIEKTGSSQTNFIKTATFAMQSYDESLYKAAELNEELKSVMLDGVDGLISLDEVSKVELNSDYNYTDTATKKYRYQAVFVVTHY